MGIKLDDVMARDWVDMRLWKDNKLLAEYEEESANIGECGNDYNTFSEHGNCSVDSVVITSNGMYYLDIYIRGGVE